MSETVLYEVSDAVATITLNRPDQLNTMGDDLLPRTVERLEEAASDDAVRAVILTGAGRAFCAGGDLGNISKGGVGEKASGKALPVERRVAGLRAMVRSSQLLRGMPKLTIAAINGACAGAGFSWACAADVRWCSEKAVFNTAFMTAGLSGDFGGTWTLPRIVGRGLARELYLLPRKFRADEALAMGLVTRVLPPDELLPYARERALEAAGYAPLTFAAIKANLNDADEASFAAHLDRESERHVRSGLTRDAAEAAKAFLEKRKPVFEGR